MASPLPSPASPKRPNAGRPPPSPLNPDAPLPDTSAPSASLSPTPPPDGRRKSSTARDLLRKHYGLGLGGAASSRQHPAGKDAADPMDLDSTAFDARSYYEQLITTTTLPALLKRENELLSEIRQLDSDRQSLVYNHHHELIAASDTISAMKTRADSLDADLDALKAAFSEISRLSAEVSIEQPSGSSARPSNKNISRPRTPEAIMSYVG